MSKLAWRSIAHTELAQLLNGAALGDSSAVGDSTVYHFSQHGSEFVAVSLPEGKAVLLEMATAGRPQRRHIDPEAPPGA